METNRISYPHKREQFSTFFLVPSPGVPRWRVSVELIYGGDTQPDKSEWTFARLDEARKHYRRLLNHLVKSRILSSYKCCLNHILELPFQKPMFMDTDSGQWYGVNWRKRKYSAEHILTRQKKIAV